MTRYVLVTYNCTSTPIIIMHEEEEGHSVQVHSLLIALFLPSNQVFQQMNSYCANAT